MEELTVPPATPRAVCDRWFTLECCPADERAVRRKDGKVLSGKVGRRRLIRAVGGVNGLASWASGVTRGNLATSGAVEGLREYLVGAALELGPSELVGTNSHQLSLTSSSGGSTAPEGLS